MNITKHAFVSIVKQSVSKSEVCKKLGQPSNGTCSSKVQKLIALWNVDISHFSHKAAMNKFQRKWTVVKKICPVCKSEFETKEHHPREKITCSHSCSNTWFRSKENNPNWKDGFGQQPEYRRICFQHYDIKCVICGFDKIVDVHHINENNSDNRKENLIPLCPNHHKMLHTNKYRQEILDSIKMNTGN